MKKNPRILVYINYGPRMPLRAPRMPLKSFWTWYTSVCP